MTPETLTRGLALEPPCVLSHYEARVTERCGSVHLESQQTPDSPPCCLWWPAWVRGRSVQILMWGKNGRKQWREIEHVISFL